MEVRELGISVHLTIPLMGQDKVIISTNAIKKHTIEKFSYIRLLIRFQIGNFIMFKRKLFKRYSADPRNMQINKK